MFEYLILNDSEISNKIPTNQDWNKFGEVFKSTWSSEHLIKVAQQFYSKKHDGTRFHDEKIIFIKENNDYSESKKFLVGAKPVLEFYAYEEDLK